MERLEDSNCEDIHTIICGTYQNILDISPAMKDISVAAKQYYKALQNVSNSSTAFQQALTKLSQMATTSKGPAKPLGRTLEDIIETHKDIETRRSEILKYMLNDFIAPLDSLIESDSIYVKSTQKNYNQDNKMKVELVEKAKSDLLKVRKKSLRKKPTEKYEEKEKQCEEQLNSLQKQLENFRKESCTKSFSEEWKRYCFIVDRDSIVLKSCMDFYEHNAGMLREHLPMWFAQVKKRPEGQANGTVLSDVHGFKGNDELGPIAQSKVKLQAIFDHNAVEVSQLSFKESDIIDPESEVVSGWQYGENLRTAKSGWFPAAYTQEIVAVPTGSSVSQTMPASGVHCRPQLDSSGTHKSLKRFASEGPLVMALPLPDYPGDLNVDQQTNSDDKTNGSQPTTPDFPPPLSPPTFNEPSSKPSTPTSPKGHPQLGIPPPPPAPPPQAADSKENTDDSGSNPFAGVTLKKTSTNDRSAPRVG